jgi:hypothetical protein
LFRNSLEREMGTVNTIGRLRLASMLAFVFTAKCALAQATGDAAPATPAAPATQSSAAQSGTVEDTGFQPPEPPVTGTEPETTGTQPEYVPALDGSGLIALDSVRHFHLLAGGTFSGGWDSNPSNAAGGASSAVYSISPYLGVQASSSRMQYIVQYQPTITHYSSFAGETMQVASGRVLGSISPRWSWTAGVKGSHGEDSVRLLSPVESVAVGSVPASGPNSASYLPNAGTVTTLDGGGSLHYDRSPRDSVDLYTGNSYNSIASLKETSGVATENFSYTHAVSQELNVIGYAQSSQYYLGLRCNTFGGGVGIRWQPRQNTQVAVKGGPQIDTPDCKAQQGFSYSASFSTRVTGRAQLYLLSERQPVTGYLGPGLWQDSVSGGYSRLVGVQDTLGFDLGYVTSSTLKNISSYHGTYFESSYSHFLRRGLAAVFSYRGYTGSSSGANFSRNVLLVSLSWTPNAQNTSR